jgi:hypothetical protein
LIVFGYAANLDVKHILTAVRDLDQSVDSRDLLSRFGSSKYFDILSYPQTPKEIETLIQKGEVILSIEIPSDFSRKLKKGDTASVQVILDGTESNTAMIALGYVGRLLSDYSTTIIIKKLNLEGMIRFEEAGVEAVAHDVRYYECELLATQGNIVVVITPYGSRRPAIACNFKVIGREIASRARCVNIFNSRIVNK